MRTRLEYAAPYLCHPLDTPMRDSAWLLSKKRKKKKKRRALHLDLFRETSSNSLYVKGFRVLSFVIEICGFEAS